MNVWVAWVASVVKLHKLCSLHEISVSFFFKGCCAVGFSIITSVFVCSCVIIIVFVRDLMTGTKVAFYFAWLQFYTAALVFPTMVGILVWWRERVHTDVEYDGEPGKKCRGGHIDGAGGGQRLYCA